MQLPKALAVLVFVISLPFAATEAVGLQGMRAPDAKAKMNWPNYRNKMCQTRMKGQMSDKQAKNHCYPYMRPKQR